MKKINLSVALFLGLLAVSAGAADLMITEVVDGDLTGGKPKWIELTNCTDESINLLLYRILVYSNENISYSTQTIYGDMTSLLGPGESFVIAGSTSGPAAEFLAAYGFEANLYHGAVNGNGNDVYELVKYIGVDSETPVDIYGRIGECIGSADYSMDWAYRDSYAYRLPNSEPNTTFDANDWFIVGNGALDEPNDPLRIQALLAHTTPTTHTCGGNDECVNALDIPYGVKYLGSTIGATGLDESSCTINDTNDLWHSFVPSMTGRYMISLDGSSYDTSLAVYDLCGGGELACNDDYYITQSRVIVQLTENQTYYIRIAGYNGDTGNYALTIALAADISKNGTVDFQDVKFLLWAWLQSGPRDADIAPVNGSTAGDKFVDFIDLTTLAKNWRDQQP